MTEKFQLQCKERERKNRQSKIVGKKRGWKKRRRMIIRDFLHLFNAAYFFSENYFMAYWNIFEIVTELWWKGTIFAFFFRQFDDNDKDGLWSISQTNEWPNQSRTSHFCIKLFWLSYFTFSDFIDDAAINQYQLQFNNNLILQKVKGNIIFTDVFFR